jgi:hypothetical protein
MSHKSWRQETPQKNLPRFLAPRTFWKGSHITTAAVMGKKKGKGSKARTEKQKANADEEARRVNIGFFIYQQA